MVFTIDLGRHARADSGLRVAKASSHLGAALEQ